ncbi:hypothetical protein H4R26_000515 [Coemansia thaxteri]|uniref:Uncharacterized protein n=1 Tax=Coemansia thaxteri TaxID=2663907 RepID=A0A9W8BNN6_9FUNG|nr:hypothetical protein H4R26_000515 [Coemansia thaxteri]KAJ2487289.1 hypothetical protein EV174_000627 [Coemansia sp. RSA 2320]
MKLSVSTFALCAVLATAAVNAQNTGAGDAQTSAAASSNAPNIDGGIGDAINIINSNTPSHTTASSPTSAAAATPVSVPLTGVAAASSTAAQNNIGSNPVNISVVAPSPTSSPNAVGGAATATTPVTNPTSAPQPQIGGGINITNSGLGASASTPVSGNNAANSINTSAAATTSNTGEQAGLTNDSGVSENDAESNSGSQLPAPSSLSRTKTSGAAGILPSMSLTALVAVAISAMFF